ncbi:MAG: cell division protein ZapA [Pseudomonadota bacterium]
MPEVEISIGGRVFEVACQEGEEHFLQAAAQLLDIEATALTNQMGRLPEARMLLMAALMLADKTAGLDDRTKELDEKLSAQDTLIAELRSRVNAKVESGSADSEGVTERLVDLADRSEAVADLLDGLSEQA